MKANVTWKTTCVSFRIWGVIGRIDPFIGMINVALIRCRGKRNKFCGQSVRPVNLETFEIIKRVRPRRNSYVFHIFFKLELLQWVSFSSKCRWVGRSFVKSDQPTTLSTSTAALSAKLVTQHISWRLELQLCPYSAPIPTAMDILACDIWQRVLKTICHYETVKMYLYYDR